MGGDEIRRRVWVQTVAVSAAALEGRLAALGAAESGRRDSATEAIAATVRLLLRRAQDAAFRDNPRPLRWVNWWRGTLIEAAFQNLHAAEAEIVLLYDQQELDAEIAEAVARVEAGLGRDDPRREEARALLTDPSARGNRFQVRKVIQVGYAAADRMHSRVRSFRNIVLISAFFIALFVGVFAVVVALNPSAVPLCFSPQENGPQVCPTGTGSPSSGDVLVVTLLGLMGGAVASAVSIRNVRGTSTPYDVPVALAFLKVPAGGLTAIAALIAIRGQFIPGLSALDSQEQILAYALAFGNAQQLLTRLIDRQAQNILSSIPSKDPESSRSGIVVVEKPPAAPQPAGEQPSLEVPRPQPEAGTMAPAEAEQAATPAPGGIQAVEQDTNEEAATGERPGPRPTEEPEGTTQKEQLALLTETGNDRVDMTEDEEARLLREQFGPADDAGIFGAPGPESRP